MILDRLIGEYKYNTVIFTLCIQNVNYKAIMVMRPYARIKYVHPIIYLAQTCKQIISPAIIAVLTLVSEKLN